MVHFRKDPIVIKFLQLVSQWNLQQRLLAYERNQGPYLSIWIHCERRGNLIIEDEAVWRLYQAALLPFGNSFGSIINDGG